MDAAVKEILCHRTDEAKENAIRQIENYGPTWRVISTETFITPEGQEMYRILGKNMTPDLGPGVELGD